ncbi:MAG: hypothetical protein ISP77_03410 [Methylophilaceae bacterium]|nr:hypothetical protein [Methylophilaceae bacterium]
MRLSKYLLILISYFVLSAGTFYAGSKFHVPWYGGNDFNQYYQMTVNPYDNDAISPFAYRVLTPTIAHYIYRSGFFYESSKTPYKDNHLIHQGVVYEPSVLSALIFTNYIFLALAAFCIYLSVTLKIAQTDIQGRLIAIGLPSFLFLSLSTNVAGYAGLTEGATIFGVSLLCYLILTNRLVSYSIICVFSITQRELLPLILFLYISSISRQERKFYFMAASGVAFAFYFLLRSYLQIPGYEGQTQFSTLLSNIFSFSLKKDFILQAILINNIPIFVLIISVCIGFRNFKPFIPFFVVATALFILGIATGIGNNVGRILNMTTPILLIGMADAIHTSLKTQRQHSKG